jgi:hypothetical protein
MTTHDSRSTVKTRSPPALWVCTLLGIVFIAAGIFALSDVVFATIISVKFIGVTAIVAGAFEIMHAFWTKGWGGFLWQILLGAPYLAFGVVLLTQPALILLPRCRAVRIGPHPLRAELRPLAPEWLDDADLGHLRRARRHLEPVRLPIHQRLGSWIPAWRRPDFARSGLAAPRVSVGAEDSVTGRGIRQ